MKLHLHLAQSVLQALPQIFDPENGRYADRVIEYHLKNNKKWGSRDRKFFAEAVYDIVRWWRRLWEASGGEPSLDEKNLWDVFGAWLVKKEIEWPSWPELQRFDREKAKRVLARTDLPRAILQSIPDWLDERGSQELGERWPKILAGLNEAAPVVLRANRLKNSVSELKTALAAEGVQTQTRAGFDDALVLDERQNVHRTNSFKLGRFEVQDFASQKVAPFLNPQPGERIVDACAGAGGKTLHIAALMKNKGRILSMDVDERKLEELRRRCSRAGVDIVETRVIEGSKTVKRLEGGADRLLLDVPCSGLGVLRRNPDAKWKLDPQTLARINGLQKDILGSYHKMVKAGGVMVYSTCSLLPSENEEQVAWFLSENPAWRLEREAHYWPNEGFDGFYMALLAKN